MFNPLKLLKKTAKVPENFVALDFGTTSTKALIFSLGEQVQLLGQGKGTPSEAVLAAATEAGVRPTQAVVGIGGENVWCLTTTIRFNRPEPDKPIEPKEVKKLDEQIFKTALMQASAQMSQFLGDPELTLQLIDSDVLFYKIDGQIVDDPLGKTGKVLESSIFTAHSPISYLSQLAEVLKGLKLNLWAVCSLMSILVKTLAKNAIILDVGGKVTDVAVVFGGGIWGTRPLPLGGETFTKAIASEEKKIAYATHQLRDEEVPKIAEKIEGALNLWLAGVETALADFDGIKTFPPRIILVGGGARLEELKEGLSAYPLMRTLPFAAPPVVEVRTDVGPPNMRLIAEDILSEGPRAESRGGNNA